MLALADNGDLDHLADLLTHDETDGNLRLAQELLGESAFVQARAEGLVGDAWRLIAAELQTFGGDGVANRIRSIKGDHTGVPYREILEDIAKYVGADLKAADGVSGCEAALIQKMLLERYPRRLEQASAPTRARRRGNSIALHLLDGTLDTQKLQDLLRDDQEFFFDAIAILRRIPQFTVVTSVAATALKM